MQMCQIRQHTQVSTVQMAQEGRGLSDVHEHTSHMWPEWDAWMGTQRKSITQSQSEMTTLRLRSRGEGDEARAPHLDPDTRQYTHTLVMWLILWSY